MFSQTSRSEEADLPPIPLTFRALPGIPHVLHADVQVGSVEAAVFGFGVVILKVLSEKLKGGRVHVRSVSVSYHV